MKRLTALIRLLAVLPGLLLLRPTAVEPAPLLINYQGSIEGTTDSTVVISFGIHPAATSGETIWSEVREISPIDGRFSILLGSLTPIQPFVFEDDVRYLSLSVDGTELAPRQRIVSVAYALQAAHAKDVDGEQIHPASIAIVGQDAAWDTLGTLSTPVIRTDSLVVGSTPVIAADGSWIGPDQESQGGLSLRSISTTRIDSTILFFFHSKWLVFSEFDVSIEIPKEGTLEVSFAAQISSNNPFKTRINLKQVRPINQFIGSFGNISGAQAAVTDEGTTVFNQGIIDVVPGRYRVLIEHQAASVTVGRLRSGSLIIRVHD